MIRLEKFLFYTFLFLIPFQIREFIFWGGNEWNSIFLYLGDILFIVIFLSAIFRKSLFTNWQIQKKDFLLILFLLIGVASLIISINSEISIFRFIKLLEFVLLYLYIRNNLKLLKSKNIILILIVSGLVQSILAIAQFLNQKSLGLKFIEAGVFNPNMPGVANFIYNGERIMRSYGSFPHPNVLAGFLLLCIFAFYLKILIRPVRPIAPIGIIGLLLTFSLFLTFSRTALFIFIFLSLAFFLIKFFHLRPMPHNKNRFLVGKRLIILFLVFAFSCFLSSIILFPYLRARFFTISFEEQAVDLRFFYNKMSLAMIKEKPLLGVGIGNFVWYSQNYSVFLRAADKVSSIEPSYNESSDGEEIPAWLFQPVHNIYLLIMVEIGILGLVLFLLFLGRPLLKWFKTCLFPVRYSLSNRALISGFIVSCFLLLGLIDHYFWTLQQGGLMFWLALSLLDS